MKCYFCDKIAKEQKKIVVDVDPCHDGEDWWNAPLYSTEWLCEDHLDMDDYTPGGE